METKITLLSTKPKSTADYRDDNGTAVDREIITVSNHKISSQGILSFSPAPPENVRLLFIADAVTHLISMVHCKQGRMDFTYAAFIAIGAKLDNELIVSALANYPKRIKIYTVFGHSLIGRIRDCKVQGEWAGLRVQSGEWKSYSYF